MIIFCLFRRGLVGSIVVAGYGFGSLIWVPFQTAYVNPDNSPAVMDPRCSNGTRSGEDTELDCDNLYFTDLDMLARVPRMFLLSGGLYALFGVISLFLISEPSNTATAAELKSIVAQSEKKQYNTIQKDDNNNSEQQQPKSLTPKEVLKTPLFYQVKTTFYFC